MKCDQELASSVAQLALKVAQLTSSVGEVKDSVDGLRITAQALLQVAAQHQQRIDRVEEEMELMKQRQAETDERFNVLLEEIRYLSRGNQGN